MLPNSNQVQMWWTFFISFFEINFFFQNIIFLFFFFHFDKISREKIAYMASSKENCHHYLIPKKGKWYWNNFPLGIRFIKVRTFE
jgi:hypothetical protein